MLNLIQNGTKSYANKLHDKWLVFENSLYTVMPYAGLTQKAQRSDTLKNTSP